MTSNKIYVDMPYQYVDVYYEETSTNSSFINMSMEIAKRIDECLNTSVVYPNLTIQLYMIDTVEEVTKDCVCIEDCPVNGNGQKEVIVGPSNLSIAYLIDMQKWVDSLNCSSTCRFFDEKQPCAQPQSQVVENNNTAPSPPTPF